MSPHILIVDDSPVDRRLMAGCCRQRIPGAIISIAHDGEDAMELIRLNRIDVVVSDINMPNMNGMELLAELRASRPQLPVILLTGHDTVFLAEEAIKAGAASYIPKGKLTQLPDSLLRVVSLRESNPRAERIGYFSCFISYSQEDQPFCDEVYERLNSWLPVWYAPKDMKAGQKLFEQIGNAIYEYDKLLLVLSTHSMNSSWVGTEILLARKRERETGSRVLFPIRLVTYEQLSEWTLIDSQDGHNIAHDIREYFIPDFRSPISEDTWKRLRNDLEYGK